MESGKKYIDQEITELTSFMVHKHYCENDVEAVIGKMDPNIIWFGAGENEYAAGLKKVAGIFRNFAGQIPKCNISEEQYQVLEIAPDTFLCAGRMWITTDSSTKINLRVHQRITTIFRRVGEQLRCCHIHISNPYDDMGNEIGFPIKMAQQSYEYFQEQLAIQKQQLASQTIALERMSYEDSLTGLYNRNKFNQVMDEPLPEKKTSMGIACFDLNGLKAENDHRGHSAGDALICKTAEQLRHFFEGKVYRTGGDEFVVIDRELTEEQFKAAIEEVQKEMAQNGISCSVGFSWRPECHDIQEQYDEADARMYQQKRSFYSNPENDRRK